MHTRPVSVVTGLLSLSLLAAAPVAVASERSAGSGRAPAARPAPLAPGAVTLGEVKAAQGGCVFGSAFGITSGAEDPTRPSYVAPFSGVLTNYSTYTDTTGGSVQVLVLKAGVDATHKVVAAKSPKQVVAPSTLSSIPTRVSIKAGERIGMGFGQSGMACFIGTSAADSSFSSSPFDADQSADFPYTGFELTGGRPNVSAVLEPDVDGDGYGDISQDLCPQSKLTAATCPPPDTKIKKKPAKVGSNRQVKIKFSSTIAGSTFTCAVDGKATKPCTSPFKKKFKYGKHVVLITATSPVGIIDPTPAKVKFKFKPPA